MKFKIYNLWFVFMLAFFICMLIYPYNTIGIIFGAISVILLIWAVLSKTKQKEYSENLENHTEEEKIESQKYDEDYSKEHPYY